MKIALSQINFQLIPFANVDEFSMYLSMLDNVMAEDINITPFSKYITTISESILDEYSMYGYNILGEWSDVASAEEYVNKVSVVGAKELVFKLYPFYSIIKDKGLTSFPKSNKITRDFKHGKKTKMTGTDEYTNSGSDETLNYGVNEDAPINSAIDVINTPANKASNKSTFTRGTSTNNTKDLTNTNSGTDTETITDENVNFFIEMSKYLNPYREQIIGFIRSLINKIIDEKNIIW